jgi:hypothetical protein
MLKLDNSLLDDLGLGSLPEDQKKAMLQHIYETLELRVGTRLANQMTDQQLEEFEKFIDDGGNANQAQALQWLESNLPHYKQVVNEVFEELKAEVGGMANQIMATTPAPTQGATPMPPTGGGPADGFGGGYAQQPMPQAPAAPGYAQPGPMGQQQQPMPPVYGQPAAPQGFGPAQDPYAQGGAPVDPQQQAQAMQQPYDFTAQQQQQGQGGFTQPYDPYAQQLGDQQQAA